MKTPQQVLTRYAAWHRFVTPEVRDAFADLIRAFTNWQPQIIAIRAMGVLSAQM